MSIYSSVQDLYTRAQKIWSHSGYAPLRFMTQIFRGSVTRSFTHALAQDSGTPNPVPPSCRQYTKKGEHHERSIAASE